MSIKLDHICMIAKDIFVTRSTAVLISAFFFFSAINTPRKDS